MVPPGREPWSLVQRSAAVGRNGAKLLGVGFGASMFGVTITNVLLEVGRPSAGLCSGDPDNSLGPSRGPGPARGPVWAHRLR